MSQIVGSTFRSRIPTFNDDASIEEALMVYHYGVDNYSTQPIPNDSIEGNFRTLTTNLNILDAAAVKRVSLTSAPNIITAQATNVVPITVKAIASQTTPLQVWQNSSSSSVAEINTLGSMFIKNSLAIGSSIVTTDSFLLVNQSSSNIKGLVIKSSESPTANLQEWQNQSGETISFVDPIGNFSISGNIFVKNKISQTTNLQEWQDVSGTALSWVDKDGGLYINQDHVDSISISRSFMLMGA